MPPTSSTPSTFLASLRPHGPARNEQVRGAIVTGNLDPPRWVTLTLGRVVLEVSADWLTVGGGRVPMTAGNAQAAVDALDAVLPTAAIVEAIEEAARAREGLISFVPWPRWQGNSQLQTSTILWREENIARRLADWAARGLAAPELIAGCLKDVVLAPWMPPGRVVIFGGLDNIGRRIQPVHPIPGGELPGHEADFDGGYAHGVRAVRDACLLDGQPASVREILAGPLAYLLGGPVAAVRYPSSTTPDGMAAPPAAAATPRTLRRGDSGPAVRELQKLLAPPADMVRDGLVLPLALDGIFGDATDAAVRRFQRAHGLEADGLAGPATMAALREKKPSVEQNDPSPAGSPEIWGVDVSEFNGPAVDWHALAAAGCAFAVMRAMTGSDKDGVMREDKLLRTHVARSRAAGIPVVGFYGWGSEHRTGAAQAALLVEVTRDLGDAWLAIDHEPVKKWVDNARAARMSTEFTLETEQLTGRAAVLYTGPWALAMAPLPTLATRPLWLAGGKRWPTQPPWKEVALWQDKIMEFRGADIDHNIFRGTVEDLAKLGAR